MELNLYGVASIKLDKLRGRDIRKYLIAAATFYAAAVALSFFFPTALQAIVIGNSTTEFVQNSSSDDLKIGIHSEEDEEERVKKLHIEHTLRYCFSMETRGRDHFTIYGNFDIESPDVKRNEEGDQTEQNLELEFNFGFYGTENQDKFDRCSFPSMLNNREDNLSYGEHDISFGNGQADRKHDYSTSKQKETFGSAELQTNWVKVQQSVPKVDFKCRRSKASGDLVDTNKPHKNQIECDSVLLLSGDIQYFPSYAGLEINVREKQTSTNHSPDYKVLDFTIELLTTSASHIYFVMALKYFFVGLAFMTAILFYKSIHEFHYEDLGVVQKWVMILLTFLVVYNDPFYPLRFLIPYKIYFFAQPIFEATYIALQLFFWILTVHSVASSEQLLNIEETKFYRPKIMLCFFLWLYLCTERAYLSYMRTQDASYYVYQNNDPWYLAIRMVGIVLLASYVIYFFIVSYMVIFVLHQMKKAYKYVILVTLTVILASLVILFFNGQGDKKLQTPLYIAQYALFNTYMFLVAYLYSPCADAGPAGVRRMPTNFQTAMNHLSNIFDQRGKEHDSIMSQFYEQELPELAHTSVDDDLELSMEDHSPNPSPRQQSQTTQESTSETTPQAKPRRRDMKKDPKVKAKEKLWESIVSETQEEIEVDSDDDSDDTEQV